MRDGRMPVDFGNMVADHHAHKLADYALTNVANAKLHQSNLAFCPPAAWNQKRAVFDIAGRPIQSLICKKPRFDDGDAVRFT